MFFEHQHWPEVSSIVGKLTSDGHTALLAGGCVRDALLGVTPKDFDIATSATPDQVERLFPESLNIGRAFGVMIVPRDGFNVEIATFRDDGLYIDGRRPEKIVFSNPQKDAARRDFTVNALFYDLQKQELIDFVDGESDVKKCILQTVGDPELRFNEDHLRLMRAVRFCAQLNFSLAESTYLAVRHNAHKIDKISIERTREELRKLLLSDRPVVGLQLMEFTNLLEVLLPEIAIDEAWLETKMRIEQVSAERTTFMLRWSLLFLPRWMQDSSFADSESEVVRKKIREFSKQFWLKWKFSKEELGEAEFYLYAATLLSGKLKIRMGEMYILLTSPWAIGARVLSRLLEPGVVDNQLAKLLACSNDVPFKLPAQLLTGEDLLQAGIKDRLRFGGILHEAKCMQLEGRLHDRAGALEWLKKTSLT